MAELTRPSDWNCWRRRLVWLSLGISLLWAGGSALLGVLSNSPLGQSVFSPGKLAAAHARWSGDCRVCHEPGAPQSVDAHWLAHGSRTGDAACLACHTDVAQTTAVHRDVAACSSCHDEHRGTDASLVRMQDVHCTRCHTNMSPHPVAARDRAAHSSGLRFDHALHLRPGLGRTDDPPARPFLWRDVTTNEGLRLLLPNGVDDDSPVELACQACHQADRSGSFEPPRFAKHCHACHRLTFAPDRPELEVPHGLQPADVITFLRGMNPPLEKSQTGPTDASVEAALRDASQLLFRGRRVCGACHDQTFPATSESSLMAIAPSKFIVSRISAWPDHAKFSHSEHHALDCRECHVAAYPGQAGASDRREVTLLPNLTDCISCHSSAGNVRHGCADCHRFHGHEHGR